VAAPADILIQFSSPCTPITSLYSSLTNTAAVAATTTTTTTTTKKHHNQYLHSDVTKSIGEQPSGRGGQVKIKILLGATLKKKRVFVT
jgi:hypothetical protein